MRSICLILTATITAALLAAPALAETSAQFAAPGFRAPDDSDVNGFRASLLYGEVDSMRGFDLGIFSVSKSSSLNGFGFVFGGTWVTGDTSGASLSFVNNCEGDATGVMASMVNIVGSMSQGANLGMVNYARGYSNIDVGIASVSEKSDVQFGLLNITEEIETLQIGLLNVAQNGFFPVFPLMNFPKD